MPVVIRAVLNEIITTQWTAAELPGVALGPYLAIELPKQEAGLDVFGIEYGAATDEAAMATIGAVAGHIFVDLPKLTATSIGGLFGSTIQPPMFSNQALSGIKRPYSRWRSGPPFDTVEVWDTPIEIEPGSSMTALIGLWMDVAAISSVQVYLLVRARAKAGATREEQLQVAL